MAGRLTRGKRDMKLSPAYLDDLVTKLESTEHQIH